MKSYLEQRTYQSDFQVCAFFATDNNFLAHWHIEVEMLYVLEGSIRIGINQETKVLTAGQIAVFGSSDVHYYDSKDLHSKIMIIIFRPEIIGSPAGWPENRRFTPAFINSNSPDGFDQYTQNPFVAIFADIIQEMKEEKPFYQLYVQGKISELCALLLRYFPSEPVYSNAAYYRQLPDISKIQFAIEYLKHNYMQDISLTQLAEKLNLSPAYFSRIFSKFTGIPFKSYLNRIRSDKAEELIKTTTKSILDISLECGFNSIRTFNRTFKSIKGYQPSQLR